LAGTTLALLMISGGTTTAAFAQKTAPPFPPVTLTCKLVGNPGDRPHSVWLIELFDAAGAPLKRTLRRVGDTFHFKNLLPGIYRISLSGKGGRRSSESIDLIPGPDPQARQFIREVKVPKAAAQNGDLHVVSARTLAVPREARQKMVEAEKDQIDGKEGEMVRHLKEAIALCPDYADAWNNLGAYYHRAGDYNQSIDSFTRVTELNPGAYMGWLNLGSSLLATGKYRKAVEMCRKALEIAPREPVVNAQLGLSHYYLHEYGEARECFKRVLAVDPAFPTGPQLFLAQIALADGSFSEAEEHLRGYLRLHPNTPEAAQAKRTLAALSRGKMVAAEPVRK
jgi:tetratricopeptide (TPR) repeat protein